MKQARYRFIFDRKKIAFDANGKPSGKPGLIEIRATLQKKQKYFSTGIKVLPNQWDNERLIKPSKQNHFKLNTLLRQKLAKLEDQEVEAQLKIERGERKQNFDVSELSLQEETNMDQVTDFVQFWERELVNDAKLTYDTKRGHQSALNRLKEFRRSVLFTDLNYPLVKDYERFLLNYTFEQAGKLKKLSKPRINVCLKIMKSYVNKAVMLDYMLESDNPFSKFKLTEYRRAERLAKRAFLTPEEVKKIEELQFTKANKHLERIRDFFMIQCYTGMSFIDMTSLKASSLKENNDKGAYIEEKRGKTDEKFYVPLHLLFNRKPEILIRKYIKQSDGRPFIFDQFTNQHINRELKVIAQLAGIDKKITTHVGRHTCATYLLYLGAPMETIKKILGHTNIRTTQIYGEVMNSSVDKALENIKFK